MQSRSNQKGMTLIEVILALGILVLLAAYFLTAITTSNTWVSRAGKNTQALGIASAILEDIRVNVNAVSAGTYAGNRLNLSHKDGGLGLSGDYNELAAGGDWAVEVIIKEVHLKDGVIAEIEPHIVSDLLKVIVRVNNQELTTIMSRR